MHEATLRGVSYTSDTSRASGRRQPERPRRATVGAVAASEEAGDGRVWSHGQAAVTDAQVKRQWPDDSYTGLSESETYA